ncbi:MAG: ferrous iron transporter B, partial [Phycisphaerales bacterium]|nr:ferrous iron transporter B [Phycisphaerales bacterium]
MSHPGTATIHAPPGSSGAGHARVALLGNPNTGKTSLFNRLSGLRHRTSNFPGTTQEARIGRVAVDGRDALDLIDLPGVYSLELEQSEAAICRAVLAGDTAPKGERIARPDAICIVTDATNLARGLTLVGEALRRRLPTVVAVNMIDLARRSGVRIDLPALERALGCPVVACCARSGEGVDALRAALTHARNPAADPPADEPALARWAASIHERVTSGGDAGGDRFTDRFDRFATHPVAGPALFALVMTGLFWSIFALATHPMGWIESLFGVLGGAVEAAVPPGIVQDLLANGVVAGVAGVLVFLPQICLLFFLISLLEDTGYLARAAFVMDRALRPFGLPGHAFVPLLSSHACALPGIIATRAIPDPRERLATILVAPFMTCSARLPVYVLATSLLFPDRPLMAALAFVGAYALGVAAGVLSALLARRTILRGASRPMALELPTYKRPSLRTAAMATWDCAVLFLKTAGTNILATCVILWWPGAYPRVAPPPEADAHPAQVAQAVPGDEAAAETMPAGHDR